MCAVRVDSSYVYSHFTKIIELHFTFLPGTELGGVDLAAYCPILCVILVQSWQQLSALASDGNPTVARMGTVRSVAKRESVVRKGALQPAPQFFRRHYAHDHCGSRHSPATLIAHQTLSSPPAFLRAHSLSAPGAVCPTLSLKTLTLCLMGSVRWKMRRRTTSS